jgi:hypothetical protein
MAMMALEELQDCNSAARGWAAMSFFVCCLYAFKADVKIVSKFVEEVEVDGTWDIVTVLVVEPVGCSSSGNKIDKRHGCTSSESLFFYRRPSVAFRGERSKTPTKTPTATVIHFQSLSFSSNQHIFCLLVSFYNP